MSFTENDYEMQRTVWDSKIPIEFALDSSQPAIRTPQSSFIMLPRVSYFPLHLDEPLRILAEHAVQEENFSNAWLLSKGEMLRWQYPIGVLYDMHNTGNDKTLPWIVTIRLKDFPPELIRCLSKDAMKFCFIQSLKEASQIKHKHNIVASMTSEEHAKLFDSICNDRFSEFWSINERLMKSEFPTRENELTNVPIRFYMHSLPFRQILIPWQKKMENDLEITLVHALTKAFPELIDICVKYEAISHGIELPMDTSVGWLAKNLSYPDNFVHIAIRPKKA